MGQEISLRQASEALGRRQNGYVLIATRVDRRSRLTSARARECSISKCRHRIGLEKFEVKIRCTFEGEEQIKT